ncbi:MAG: peptidase T [Chitinophagaceae bacterium]
MINIDKKSLSERFMRYVQVDTQSDPQSITQPTSEKQKDLARILVDELHAMGIADAELDDYGYVYATLSSNSPKTNIPVICFCSHVDTAPDCSGTNVKPILHENYSGADIVLPADPLQVLKISEMPYLKNHIGGNIITTSGDTLLGADDKSGVAIIMEAVSWMIQNPRWIHGDIRILFTPDEEVGKGTAKLDMERLSAQYGYTLDGGEAGSLEDETFSADGATITIHGVIVHPGYAKGILINALKLAGEILDHLPKEEWSPETTSDREGFVHPVRVEGISEKATIEFIVRDFTETGLRSHHDRLERIARNVVEKYPGSTLEYMVKEQYRNMKGVLDMHPQVISNAQEAIRRSGLEVKTESIRGGTDGSRLSFMGLPCPNLFAGMQAIHSKLEWIGVNDMAKSAETVVHLASIWEERS